MINETKNLEELARFERLDYFKQWRAANKDKVKRHKENYWRKKAEQKLRNGESNVINQ